MNKSGVDYEHLTAILQEGNQVMKERFYLDELFVLRLEDGTDGVIGMVAEGSENEKMHNLNTRGGVGRAYKGGRVVRMLNDAGLNTKGSAYSDPSDGIRVDSDSIKFEVISAYYVDTTRTRIYYKLNSDYLLYYDSNTIYPQGTRTEVTATNPFNGLVVGQLLELKAVITNNEGDSDVQLPSRIVQPTAPVASRYNTMWPSYAFNNTNETTIKNIMFTQHPVSVGGNVLFSPPASISDNFSGYYIINVSGVDKWIKVFKTGQDYEIEMMGICELGGYPAGDPGNNYPMPFYLQGVKYARAQDYGDLYASCLIEPTGNSFLYRDKGKYYENWSSTTNVFTSPYTGYLLDNNGCVAYQFTNGLSPTAPTEPIE